MSGMNDKSAFESFDRMAEKIEAIERKALAAAEIQAEFQSDYLMEQFKKLEYKGTADQQLLELKAKMGLLGGRAQDTRQLGAGANPTSGGAGSRMPSTPGATSGAGFTLSFPTIHSWWSAPGLTAARSSTSAARLPICWYQPVSPGWWMRTWCTRWGPTATWAR